MFQTTLGTLKNIPAALNIIHCLLVIHDIQYPTNNILTKTGSAKQTVIFTCILFDLPFIYIWKQTTEELQIMLKVLELVVHHNREVMVRGACNYPSCNNRTFTAPSTLCTPSGNSASFLPKMISHWFDFFDLILLRLNFIIYTINTNKEYWRVG